VLERFEYPDMSDVKSDINKEQTTQQGTNTTIKSTSAVESGEATEQSDEEEPSVTMEQVNSDCSGLVDNEAGNHKPYGRKKGKVS
jgi:hypothetical protein